MRVAFATDERTPVSDAIRAHLLELGHEVAVLRNALQNEFEIARTGRRTRADAPASNAPTTEKSHNQPEEPR